MKTTDDKFGFWEVLLLLGKIWEPAGKAFEVQSQLGIHSLEGSIGALERAGYEVALVDLPSKVSGYSKIIFDRPHIVLNREQALQELHFTLPHELGHHVLHLNPAPEPNRLGFPGTGDREFEANLFATAWLVCLKDEQQKHDALRSNPESSQTLAIYVFLSLTLVLFFLLAALVWQRAPETK